MIENTVWSYTNLRSKQYHNIHDMTVFLGTPASLSKRSLKQKMRKKNNWVKKKLKSSDISVSLMSELPFSATSPTTWKELGCV